MEQRRKGVTLMRRDGEVSISNNRRCRVRVVAEGVPFPILLAAGPRDWHPSVSLGSLPEGAVVTIVPELEGPRGPRPDYSGPFEPDESQTFTLHVRAE